MMFRRYDDFASVPTKNDPAPSYTNQKPQTNADRIRAMSDEEMADFVWGVETAGRAYGPRGKKSWLDWLRQEVSE